MVTELELISIPNQDEWEAVPVEFKSPLFQQHAFPEEGGLTGSSAKVLLQQTKVLLQVQNQEPIT